MKKTGVLLLNMGGPDSLASVKPFLYNLFSDPEIIKLPFSAVLQPLLAWLIVQARGKEACHNYALMGGSSPQLPLTTEQAQALSQETQLPVYIAMRYWHPFTAETLTQIEADGITDLIVLTLYPHFSYTTTGSSFNALKRELRKLARPPKITFIAGYHRFEPYLEALAECVRQGLEAHAWSCEKQNVHLLFSAHSLPLSHIKRTKDPYPELIFQCAKSIMQRYFPEHLSWDLCYQSKVGRMPWLGPYTDSALRFLAAKKVQNILIIPISFVTDHVETLVEIDQQYIPLAQDLGIPNCHRAPALNSRKRFIDALAQLVQARSARIQEATHVSAC